MTDTTTVTSAAERTGHVDQEAVREGFIQRARELRPLLREQASKNEQGRQLTPEVANALREGGFLKMCQPAHYGGPQANMRTILEVTRELAIGDAAASWVSMILSDASYVAALYPKQALDDMWIDDPEASVAAVINPQVVAEFSDGNYRVGGSWKSGSGSVQAQWVLIGFVIGDSDAGPGGLRLALVPKSDMTIVDDWYMAGMAGTGSHSLQADELIIPEHRVIRFEDFAAGQLALPFPDAHEYRGAPMTSFCVPLLGPVIGTAQAALEYAIAAIGKGKPIAYSFYEKSIDSPAYRLNIADAASMIDTALLHARRAADDSDRYAAEDVFPDDVARARIRMDLGVAATQARAAIDLLLNTSGVGSFALANPLQRAWRDLETATRHPHINADLSREMYANALLDYSPNVAPF